MTGRDLYDPDNRWRDRHPAEKAAFAGGFLLLAVAAGPPGVLAAVLGCVSLGAVLGAGVAWRRYLAGLAAPAGFLLMGAVPLLVADAPAAGRLMLRGLAATACLVCFAATTSLPEVLGLLRAARCPALVTEWMLLTDRFARALLRTVDAVRLAQRLRLGLETPAARLRATGALAAGLVPRTLDRARRLERGLACRGYDGALRVLAPARRVSAVRVGGTLGAQLLLAAWAVGDG